MKTYAIFDDSFFQKKPIWMPKKLYQVVCYRSNPRSKEYMFHLLHEKFPKAIIVEADQLPSSQRVVLLYPDSIGLGWKKIEKRCARHFKVVTVLNGRKRMFTLSPAVYRHILFRRFLEITFLPELLFTPFVLLYSILIAFKDKISGKL